MFIARFGGNEFRVGLCEFVDRPCFSGQTKTIHESHELDTNQNTSDAR